MKCVTRQRWSQKPADRPGFADIVAQSNFGLDLVHRVTRERFPTKRHTPHFGGAIDDDGGLSNPSVVPVFHRRLGSIGQSAPVFQVSHAHGSTLSSCCLQERCDSRGSPFTPAIHARDVQRRSASTPILARVTSETAPLKTVLSLPAARQGNNSRPEAVGRHVEEEAER